MEIVKESESFMEGDLHDLIKPVAWLVGKWKTSEADGKGILFKDSADGEKSGFNYTETLEFTICGKQPVLRYSGTSSNPTTQNPMHLEGGFLRGCLTDQFAFMVAHNFGVVSIEEGKLTGQKELTMTSIHVNRMTLAGNPAVEGTKRIFKINPDTGDLTQEFWMATSTHPELSKHLEATYVRV